MNKFLDNHHVPFAGSDGKILPLRKRIAPALDVFLFNRAAAERGVQRILRLWTWLKYIVYSGLRR